MALPRKLERFIGKITPQTELEGKLLRTLVRKLESSLATLSKTVDKDCAEGCYDHLIDCLFDDAEAIHLDQYETWVERCIAHKLGRVPTEAEEALIGELLNQITGITEVVLTLGGMTLVEEEEPEEDVPGANPGL
ncbi:MAG: hypothetical protein ACOY94_11200 [Bacillota bacterium]